VSTGDLLPVRYDPKDHSKIEIDSEAVKRGREAAREYFKRRAIERGEAQLAAVSSLAAGPAGDAVTKRGRAPTFAEIKAMGAAKAKGDSAEIDRLTARFSQFERGTVPAPHAEPSDRLDRLQKLADLHDRGALTDAEFAAEKAKVLNES
jgi:hypothetical protein